MRTIDKLKPLYKVTIPKIMMTKLATSNNVVMDFKSIVDLFCEILSHIYNIDVLPEADITFKYDDLNKHEIAIYIFRRLEVVEKIENSEKEILLKDISKKYKDINVGDFVYESLDFKEHLQRGNINKIKLIFKQRCISYRNSQLYNKMFPYKGKIIIGTVDMINLDFIKIKYDGVYGYFPSKFQINSERFNVGDKIELYVEDVIQNSNRLFPLIFSRSSNNFLKQIMIDEIPEINDGIVKIEKIVRLPGIRSKIALSSSEKVIDPVASCVGRRGMRINNISHRASNEKIDLFEWNDDELRLLENAFVPIEILKVIKNSTNEGFKIIVYDEDINQAIGKKGTNAKLVSLLLNKPIKIISLSEAVNEGFKIQEEIVDDSEEKHDSIKNVAEKTINENLSDNITKKEPFINKNIDKKDASVIEPKTKTILKDRNNKDITKELLKNKTNQKKVLKLEEKLELEKSFNNKKHDNNFFHKKNKKKRKKENILEKIVVAEEDLDNYDNENK